MSTISVHGFEGRWRIVANINRNGETILLVDRTDKLMFVSRIRQQMERVSGPHSFLTISEYANQVPHGKIKDANWPEALMALTAAFYLAVSQIDTPHQNQTKH
ncbi:MAG: hypothetical protein JKX72_03830 [Robiginitomaculum sp.]|nr:hypothetical protein [Robiginitomaculum sp.]